MLEGCGLWLIAIDLMLHVLVLHHVMQFRNFFYYPTTHEYIFITNHNVKFLNQSTTEQLYTYYDEPMTQTSFWYF